MLHPATGTPLATELHVARTVCRRAERRVVTLASRLDHRSGQRNRISRIAFNLLFVLARRQRAGRRGRRPLASRMTSRPSRRPPQPGGGAAGQALAGLGDQDPQPSCPPGPGQQTCALATDLYDAIVRDVWQAAIDEQPATETRLSGRVSQLVRSWGLLAAARWPPRFPTSI